MSISTTKRFASSTPSAPTETPPTLPPLPNDGLLGSQKLTTTTTKSPTLSSHEVKQIVKSSPMLSQLSNDAKTSFEYLAIPDDIDETWLDQAQQEINLIKERDNWTPLGLRGAAVFIEQLASTLGVQVPEQHGTEIYLELLQDLPTGPAQRAQRALLSTHNYKTLPLPAAIKTEVSRDYLYRQILRLENQISRYQMKLRWKKQDHV